MPFNARNIKLLSKEQLQVLKDKYTITYEPGKVIVDLNTRTHTVIHNANKVFTLRCEDRRVTINPKSTRIWREYFKDTYALFDIQHAINLLTVKKMVVNKENIQTILNDI